MQGLQESQSQIAQAPEQLNPAQLMSALLIMALEKGFKITDVKLLDFQDETFLPIIFAEHGESRKKIMLAYPTADQHLAENILNKNDFRPAKSKFYPLFLDVHAILKQYSQAGYMGILPMVEYGNMLPILDYIPMLQDAAPRMHHT